MATADVTVMGGGIFGLAIAYTLCLRGAKVRLIERHHVGGRHRECLKTDERQPPRHARRLPGDRRSQKIEPGAKAKLGHHKTAPKAPRQTIATVKNMARLRQAIVKREIGIVEQGRDRHHAISPVHALALVLCCHLP